jgi:hypothetical protein
MCNQHSGGPQAVRALPSKKRLQVDALLKDEKYHQRGRHDHHIQKEPGEDFGK